MTSTVRSESGGITVEAAVVFPLLILIIAGMIAVSGERLGAVRSACETYSEEAEKRLEEVHICPEEIMRGKLMLK